MDKMNPSLVQNGFFLDLGPYQSDEAFATVSPCKKSPRTVGIFGVKPWLQKMAIGQDDPNVSQCIQMSSWVYVVAYTLNDRPYGIYIYVSVCLQPLGRHNYWDLNILCPFGFDSICATLVDCKRDSFRWLFELILCELVVWNVGNTKRHCNPPPVISNDELRHFSHLRSLVQA